MPQKSSVPLEKHTLRLRAGDVDRLRDKFPDLPINAVIRRIISNYIDVVDPLIDEDKLNALYEELKND